MLKKSVSILGAGWLGDSLATYLAENGYAIHLSTASAKRYEKLKMRYLDKVFRIEIEAQKVIGDWERFLDAEVLVVNIPPDYSNPTQEQFAALLPLIANSSIQQVVFVSSTSVYPNLNRVVTEDEGVENKEHLLYKSERAFQQTEGFTTTVLRFAGLIGGKRHPGRFFQRSGIIKQGNTPVNLLHRVDCLECIHQIITKDYWGKVVNACADEHPLKKDFYPKAAVSIGLPAPMVEESSPVAYKIISNKKIKEEVGILFKEADLMTLLEHWY